MRDAIGLLIEKHWSAVATTNMFLKPSVSSSDFSLDNIKNEKTQHNANKSIIIYAPVADISP